MYVNYVNGVNLFNRAVQDKEGFRIDGLIDPDNVPNYQVGTGMASNSGYRTVGGPDYYPPAFEEQGHIFDDGYDLGDGMRWLYKGTQGFFQWLKHQTANDETKAELEADSVIHNIGNGTATDGSSNSGAKSGADISNNGKSDDQTGYDQSAWTIEQQKELDEAERRFNSEEAEKQRNWEAEMSNTAIQRAVADIKAAGLNPWLALNGGSLGAASTPSGAVASASSGSAHVPFNYSAKLLSTIVSSASSLIGALAKAIFG